MDNNVKIIVKKYYIINKDAYVDKRINEHMDVLFKISSGCIKEVEQHIVHCCGHRVMVSLPIIIIQ
ncbi:hypothetical protein GCM10007968_21450 [Sporolactobacillus putidus]|uniref:Uncharacterized protein n=1 Tax=Sporolactobacillus putidus TaxID=492735 RepID=A0A917W2W8_9BACL|nr:hypothetical protein GCM10007968_21450 [Sporolactobacillus putidus]